MDTPVLIITSILAVMIVIEWLFSHYHDHENYASNDTRANLGIAFLGLAVNSVFKVFTLVIFSHLSAYAIFEFPMTAGAWLLLFILSDLIYYLFHWVGHVSRFFWAAHVVHHSSVKYNFSTAVRAPVMNFFYRFTFWIPLCIIGFPPYAILALESGIFIYQFFLHTKYIGKLGWVEHILNTPSHHRVHHSVNPEYIDKNFGGVLIVWDRLFNTFQEEVEEPVYGITKNLKTCRITTILFHEWLAILNDFIVAKTWNDKWNVVFAKPGKVTGFKLRPIKTKPDTRVTSPGFKSKPSLL